MANKELVIGLVSKVHDEEVGVYSALATAWAGRLPTWDPRSFMEVGRVTMEKLGHRIRIAKAWLDCRYLQYVKGLVNGLGLRNQGGDLMASSFCNSNPVNPKASNRFL